MDRKELIKIYGEITDCPFCDGYMVPSKIDYEGVFRGKKLLIHNFPVFKCKTDGCSKITYGLRDLINLIRKAALTYDTKSKQFIYYACG